MQNYQRLVQIKQKILSSSTKVFLFQAYLKTDRKIYTHNIYCYQKVSLKLSTNKPQVIAPLKLAACGACEPLQGWYNNWEHMSTFFKYDAAIPEVIYTTNNVETFHRQYQR